MSCLIGLNLNSRRASHSVVEREETYSCSRGTAESYYGTLLQLWNQLVKEVRSSRRCDYLSALRSSNNLERIYAPAVSGENMETYLSYLWSIENPSGVQDADLSFASLVPPYLHVYFRPSFSAPPPSPLPHHRRRNPCPKNEYGITAPHQGCRTSTVDCIVVLIRVACCALSVAQIQ